VDHVVQPGVDREHAVAVQLLCVLLQVRGVGADP
jgi:hypothetical protein